MLSVLAVVRRTNARAPMVEVWLTKSVKESLDQGLIKNATFIAERLYASFPTEVRHSDVELGLSSEYIFYKYYIRFLPRLI